MSKVKKITAFLITICLLLTSSVVSASATTVKWTKRYDTLKSSVAVQSSAPRTNKFTIQGKKNKKLYIQMHVGYDKSLYTAAEKVGFTDKSYYYDTIKNKTRFDITVRDAKGKTVASYKNVKYGHVTALKSSNQKYEVTVRSYFSSFNYGYNSNRGASFYAQWSASYYFK